MLKNILVQLPCSFQEPWNVIVRLLSSDTDQFNALTNSSYSYKLVLRENVKNHKSKSC